MLSFRGTHAYAISTVIASDNIYIYKHVQSNVCLTFFPGKYVYTYAEQFM